MRLQKLQFDDLNPSLLKEIASKDGFLALENHGISLKTQREMFEIQRQFFNSPDADDKDHFAYDPQTNHGFVKIGLEKLNSLQKEPDYKEAFNVRKDLLLAGQKDVIPAQWPAEKLLEFTRACHEIVMELLRCLATSLDLNDIEYFTRKHKITERSGDVLRFLHYPKSKEPGIIAGAHSDYGTMTLLFLAEDDPGGLEILHQGKFQQVQVEEPGVIIVNIGDLLEYWTGDYLKSTVHRVVSRERERYSMAYFCHAQDDALLERIELDEQVFKPCPRMTGENNLYEDRSIAKLPNGSLPRTAGEHLGLRLRFTR